MDVTVIVQGTLHTAFHINRKRVLEAMSVEARRLGLDVTWDWTVYRLPAYRRLMEYAGIGNTVSFALRAGGRTHERLLAYRDVAVLARYLDSVRRMDVFDGFNVHICDRPSEDREPVLVHCSLAEFPTALVSTLRRPDDDARTGAPIPETIYFLSLPPRAAAAAERA